MTSLILFISIVVVWIAGSLVMIFVLRERGALFLSAKRMVFTSAPLSLSLWGIQKWRLSCYLLGIIEHYTDEPPSGVITVHSANKAKATYTPARGGSLSPLFERLEAVAEHIEAVEYKVLTHTSRVLEVMFMWGERDFLNTTVEWDYSLRSIERIPEKVALGVDENGEQVIIPLTGGHTLVAGNTGSGKGSVLWSIIGALAGRDDTQIRGVDLKGGVEFGMNRGVFHSVSTTKDEFAQTIEEVAHTMNERLAYMLNNGLRSMPITPETPAIALIIDEALDITDMSRQKEYADTVEQFDEILRKARAVGITVIAALQNPNVSAFPYSKKFTQTIVLRMSGAQQGGAIGFESLEVLDMSTLPHTVKGVGIVRAESGEITPVKIYYPSDDVIRSLPRALISAGA